MTVVDQPQDTVNFGALAQALMDLLTALWSIVSIRRVGVSTDANQIDLWVLMDHEVSADAAQILRLHRDFRERTGFYLLELRIVPLSEVDPTSVPTLRVLFDR